MTRAFQYILGRWNQYWFAEEPVIGLALFRIAFGASAFLYHAPRIVLLKDIYTGEGFLWPIKSAMWHWIVRPLSLAEAFGIHTVLLIALAALILGYRTRLAALVSFFLHSYLMFLENFSVYSEGRVISIFLFLLIFSDAGAWLSFDARRNRNGAHAIPFKSAALRMVIIWQLASMYIGNAAMKVYYGLDDWLSGNIILWALESPEWSQPWIRAIMPAIRDSEILPIVIRAGFFGFLFLGIGLLFLRTRPYAAVFGLFWHWATLVTTTISPGWLAWVSAYTLLVDPRQWVRYWKKVKADGLSAIGYSAVAVLVAALFILSAFYEV